MGFLFYIVGKKLFLDTSYFKFLVYFIYLKKNSLHVLKTRAKIIIPFRLETNTDSWWRLHHSWSSSSSLQLNCPTRALFRCVRRHKMRRNSQKKKTLNGRGVWRSTPKCLPRALKALGERVILKWRLDLVRINGWDRKVGYFYIFMHYCSAFWLRVYSVLK